VYSHLLVTFASSRGVLRVADELDQVGEAQLRRRIEDALDAGCRVLEVDCGRVRHIERPSLIALSEAKAHLESRGGALVVTKQSIAFKTAALASGFADLAGSDGVSAPPVRLSQPARLRGEEHA
jgi:hypothetical protein